MPDSRRYGGFELYRRLLLEARPCWPHIFALCLLSLLSIPLSLLTPLPLKLVVDSVVGSHPLPLFLQVLGLDAHQDRDSILLFSVCLIVIIASLSGLLALANSMLRTHAGEQLLLSFRAKLFRHLQRLSMSYHDNMGVNDSVYRIQYDAPAIQWVPIDGVIPFLTAGMTLLGMLAVIARIDWQLALVAVGTIPVLYAATRYYGPRMRSQWHEIRSLETGTFSIVQEALSSLRLVKAFGREEREGDRFVERALVGAGARFRAAVSESLLAMVVGLTTGVGTALVLYIGIKRVQTGSVTLGDLLLVMSYLAQLLVPLATLSRMTGHLQNSLASAERVFALLDQGPDVSEQPHPIRLDRASGRIAFHNVSFAYMRDQPVLRSVTMEIPAGTRVGIIGKTGAGKTTFLNLLMRFCDPTEGAILLDDVDLRELKLADLRNQFSIVLQESIVFSTTLEENIAYGRSGASHDQIVEAAKSARAHDFICGLPKGYASTVGERGTMLSGGERQRIALARAFLKDAPILVLDEPTSSVDAATEAEILGTLERLSRGRTVFLITHRSRPLSLCDVVFKLVDGTMMMCTDDEIAPNRGDTRTHEKEYLFGSYGG
jgi:ATP-binding cassette, subfamily B, bacterial